MTNAGELKGKVALVTGGSRGIGAAIVLALAGAGADVALTFRDNVTLAEEVAGKAIALGVRAVAIQADSADPEAVKAAVDSVAADLGRLDILVNSAGIAPAGAFDDASLADFDRAIAVHARAPFFAAQAAARHMGEGGRIISIGTNMTDRVASGGLSVYVTTKSALVGMTKALARELGPRGITVNLVNPGLTDTDMNPADGPYAEPQRQLTALGRFGVAEDIGAMVAHLAGPGGRQVTGASFLVDGGFNA